jgi:hypothetical protein
MNHDMIELNDEQLDMVAGGNDAGFNFEQQILNKINTSINVNTIVAPTVSVALFSKDIHVAGAQSLIGNTTHQN